ncbi:hypothetical protein MKX01_038748 [Papaver californicum]|nr:hypothetical protein MKX01_038748 [Papaver californicum]
MASLISNYNDRIRLLLDAIDKLRHLQVMNEGIQLPTIVLVGDQLSGMSSVLETLAGISLPRGQGICTRVPLIMHLQNHASPERKLLLEFCGKVVDTDEAHISEAISSTTEEIAGNGKCISNTPLTLVVNKKKEDLTTIDLPGITWVPVDGRTEDIYEQINNIIMEYIVPKESIILNVLSAGVDFPTCETLAVVTKVDKSQKGRIADETYDEVRATTFLPEIIKKINEKLNKNAAELNNMPRHFLRKILIVGEYNEFSDDVKMHCTARLAEILDGFSADLETKSAGNSNKDKYLEDEMKVLGETKGVGLPNFLPRTALQTMLQKRIDVVAESPNEFLEKAWNYVEDIFVCVLVVKSESHPQLQSFIRWAAHNLIIFPKTQSNEPVKEIVEMEKMTDYSCTKRLPFEMLCEVEFGYLQDEQIVEQAFDIKMRIMAYWNIVMRRLVNSLALHLVFTDVVVVVLNISIKLLRKSKDAVAKILDRISANGQGNVVSSKKKKKEMFRYMVFWCVW